MAKIRFSALEELAHRKPLEVPKRRRVSEIFGCDVLTIEKMRQYLSIEAFKKLEKVMIEGGTIDRGLADQVAAAMKAWAVEKGATHYTHWFHPLNGATAEKHDGFIDLQKNGSMIEAFDGRMLVQQEPDASSFPNGGIRNTFEARGYTAWDPGSPAFINNNTLCIPTVFVAYTGEALDYKTPMLKALALIDKAAVGICQYFDKDVEKVTATLGWEQEYFLVDEALFNARPDLKLCGRTLMGHSAAKDQQLEDHYFGAIPERVNAFMDELEYGCHRLGIPAKTRHNECAPNQFELAPIFEEANLAVDHNQLLMSTMKRIAKHHKFRVLLHEKPYKGINGSGKHNNWSLLTDTGVNLLSPGKNPKSNMQFLVFLVATTKAVLEQEALFKACIVSLGNERRLGGDEAPPVIMSVFLGEQLEDVVKQLVETGEASHCLEGGKMETGVSAIPDFAKDATDRNRTSPFAFTGNKFEFRSVGSSDSVGSPNTTLNAIVAEAFCEAADELEQAEDFDQAVHDLIKKYFSEHQRIIFNGNGYAPEWVEEAKRRGLPNLISMVDAVDTLTTDKAVKLFEKFKIFTRAELESREEILYETYAKTLNIEALTMIHMASRQLLPVCISYSKKLADAVIAVTEAGADASVQEELLNEVSRELKSAKLALEALKIDEEKAGKITDAREQAFFYKDVVKEDMDALRAPIDHLEMLVEKDMWPMPTYADLMFEV